MACQRPHACPLKTYCVLHTLHASQHAPCMCSNGHPPDHLAIVVLLSKTGQEGIENTAATAGRGAVVRQSMERRAAHMPAGAEWLDLPPAGLRLQHEQERTRDEAARPQNLANAPSQGAHSGKKHCMHIRMVHGKASMGFDIRKLSWCPCMSDQQQACCSESLMEAMNRRLPRACAWEGASACLRKPVEDVPQDDVRGGSGQAVGRAHDGGDPEGAGANECDERAPVAQAVPPAAHTTVQSAPCSPSSPGSCWGPPRGRSGFRSTAKTLPLYCNWLLRNPGNSFGRPLAFIHRLSQHGQARSDCEAAPVAPPLPVVLLGALAASSAAAQVTAICLPGCAAPVGQAPLIITTVGWNLRRGNGCCSSYCCARVQRRSPPAIALSWISAECSAPHAGRAHLSSFRRAKAVVTPVLHHVEPGQPRLQQVPHLQHACTCTPVSLDATLCPC